MQEQSYPGREMFTFSLFVLLVARFNDFARI